MRAERHVHLHPDHATLIERDATDRVLVVCEENEGGRARVRVHVPEGRRGLGLQLSGKEVFSFLQDRQNADGHLLVEETPGHWTAHVVECKATVGSKAWKKAQAQIAASMVRLQIVADFLGIEITSWRAWVAFQREKLSSEETVDPVTLKLPVGEGPTPQQVSLLAARASWEAGEVAGAFGERVACGRIQLDEEGEADADLT